MESINERLEAIKANGYELDFGTVFEQAFENYKKIAWYAGLLLLVFTFLFGIVIAGIGISILGAETITHFLKPENLKPENFSDDFLLIYTSSVLLLTCLLSPFQSGFLKMADCGEKGEAFQFTAIFSYYKSPYFGTLFISTLIISLFSLGISALVGQNLSILTSFIVTFFTFLTIPLIVFGQLNAINAIRSSILIISKQPLLILGLLTVATIGACVGFFVFFIGLFFTMPLIYSMQYTLYNCIIGVDPKNE